MFDFSEETCNRQHPSKPTKYMASLSLGTDHLMKFLTVVNFIPRPDLYFFVVNNQFFFIACECSLQKWIVFAVFEQRIADRNVVH